VRKFKVGDTVKWSGNFVAGFKDGKTKEDIRIMINSNINFEDYIIREQLSGIGKIIRIGRDVDLYDLNIDFIFLENGKQFPLDAKNITLIPKKKVLKEYFLYTIDFKGEEIKVLFENEMVSLEEIDEALEALGYIDNDIEFDSVSGEKIKVYKKI